MNLNINFLPPYCDYIGEKKLNLNLPHSEITIRSLMEFLFEKYPEFKIRLAERNLINGDTPYAMFVVNNQKSELESVVHDGDKIFIFISICGG